MQYVLPMWGGQKETYDAYEAAKAPQPPEAPKPPTRIDTAGEAARQMRESQRRRGRAATILAGQDDIGQANVARKKLLGG